MLILFDLAIDLVWIITNRWSVVPVRSIGHGGRSVSELKTLVVSFIISLSTCRACFAFANNWDVGGCYLYPSTTHHARLGSHVTHLPFFPSRHGRC
jgi:hypothetical protein